MKKDYKISVVMPIYNTERYLEDSIQSIVMQSLGFDDNIQLILVNDCSTDNSWSICEHYRKQYPNNVMYIPLPVNSGVSVARNTGMQEASGKYITFMDSDDMWSLNAFERAIGFLETSGETIDLVSADIEFFDASSDQHPLNIGLRMDRIVEMNEQYSWIRSISSTCIIKAEVAKQYRFNENQRCWEDTVYVNRIMMRRQMFGMLATDVIYYYRKRHDNTSASQSYGKNKAYFLHEPMELYQGIYRESMKKCGCFAPMAQYLVAYALGYRFRENTEILTQEEQTEYSKILQKILIEIEDKYILEIPNADDFTKKTMLAFKRGIDFRDVKEQYDELNREKRSLIERGNRTNMNYRLLAKWFALRGKGVNLSEYFETYGYRRIAIYGMADLGQFLFQELQESDIEVAYAIDRRADKLTADITILNMEDELPAVDMIVVTAAYFYSQITEDLKDKVDCPILSIEDVLNYWE